MQELNAAQLKAAAARLGFNLIGITPAQPSPHLAAYREWIAAGMHGAMGYLARPDRLARREDLNIIVPGAQSLIMVGVDYTTLTLPDAVRTDPLRGRIAAYAWGADYHDVLVERLKELAGWLAQQGAGRQRVYVDTGAIIERSHGQQAGLGFIGKNTLLINPRRGSYFLLGEIITDAAFDCYDQPERATMCGSCTRCQSACPTAAFPRPYVLDARRCISYLTIENKGSIDPALRPQLGNWVFGCDVCQEVCPWQRFAIQTQEPAFFPASIERAAPRLDALLRLTEAEFTAQFAGSPLERARRERLVRNACVAAGNSGQPVLLEALYPLLSDPSPLVRGHAAWACGQLGSAPTRHWLEQQQQREADPKVHAELTAALHILG